MPERVSRLAAGLLVAAALAMAQMPGKPAAVLAPVLSELKQKTQIPVLLPGRLPAVLARNLYASVEATATGYTIRLESEPDCNHADVCFVGILSAAKGAPFSFPRRCRSARGCRGIFSRPPAPGRARRRPSSGKSTECSTPRN